MYDGDVTGVWASGAHLIVATTKSVWMDGHKVSGYGDIAAVGFSSSMGVPVAVQHQDEIPVFNNCVSQSPVPFGLNAQRVVGSGGRLFVKNRDKVFEVTLNDVGGQVVASTRTVASVLPQASLLFPGGVVQNMLGSTFVSIFSIGPLFVAKGASSHQIRIKELDEYRVLGGKYDEGIKGGVLMITATKKGKVDRLVFRFDSTFSTYDVRKVEDIQSADLNFIVTDAGVCILLDGDNDCIELSSTKMGSTQVKTVTDSVIGGDMRLFKRGTQVLVARADRVYTMRMK